jgi:hypothetical protein
MQAEALVGQGRTLHFSPPAAAIVQTAIATILPSSCREADVKSCCLNFLRQRWLMGWSRQQGMFSKTLRISGIVYDYIQFDAG